MSSGNETCPQNDVRWRQGAKDKTSSAGSAKSFSSGRTDASEMGGRALKKTKRSSGEVREIDYYMYILSVYLFIYLFIYLSICLSISLSLSPYIYMCIYIYIHIYIKKGQTTCKRSNKIHVKCRGKALMHGSIPPTPPPLSSRQAKTHIIPTWTACL
jgi:hypothetical protein